MIKRFIRRVLGLSDQVDRVPRERHGLARDALTPAAAKVCTVLREAGFSAYVVGGAVRDLLLGIVPKDFDVATDARPEQIKPLFRRALIIGRRFRLVRAHQIARRRRNHRRDAKPHEFAAPVLELLGGVRGEGPQREGEVLVDVERSRDVLLVISSVLRFIALAMEHPVVHQELPPFIVAIAGEQRVVQIEKSQAHARPSLAAVA